MRRRDEWDTSEVQAKLLTDPYVHLVVDQPKRDLGDLRRELLDFDAVELVHVDLNFLMDVEKPRTRSSVHCSQYFELELTELPVSNHEEVAAAARRVKKRQGTEPLVKIEQAVLVALDSVELLPQLVQEQRLDELEDVLLRR